MRAATASPAAAGTRSPIPGSRRRFARILPIAFVTYSLAFVDRVNYGFGAAAGMAASLGISAQASALLGAVFFLGYLLFQIPSAGYAAHRSARRIVFWSLILWGIFSSLTGVISDLRLLLLDRFCLGIAEGVVMPAMLVYLTHWFSREERSRANALLILGNPVTLLWASAASGFLVQATGWRLMFIIEGAPSILWAFAWWFLARDWPREAAWVPLEEVALLEASHAREQQGLAPVRHYWQALRSAPVLLLSAQLFFWSFGLYGLALWLPKIIHDGDGGSLGRTGLLSAAPYLFGVVFMIGASVASDRTLRRKAFVWPFLLVGSGAFLGFYLFGPTHFLPAYSCLLLAGGCLYAGYAPFFSILPELVPRSVVGESLAMINSCGAAGGFLGAYAVGWIQAATGSASAGFILLSGALLLAAACMIPLRAR
jgi:sugar phosphate permease